MTDRAQLARFFLAAFGIAWTAVLVVVAPSGIPGEPADVERLIGTVFLVMLLGPSIAGVLMTVAADGKHVLGALARRFGRWRLGRWYGLLLVTPAVLLGLAAAFGSVSSEFQPALVAAADRTPLVLLAVGYGLGAGFFEELGWTGFALPRMQAHLGALRGGVMLGVIWGVWHLLPSYWGTAEACGDLYTPYFLVWCIGSFTAFRVLMAWAYSRTGSLLLAQLMHASFTGGQVLLAPTLAPGAPSLVWYAMFAVLLWGGVIVLVPGMRRRRRVWEPAGALTLVAALFAVFVTALEPWLLNWGATPAERSMVLPGDTAEPTAYFTRAISIDRPPSEVWPWLVQIGRDRGGFYSNDWLENLVAADIHNADRIDPAWQTRSVGDRIPMTNPWQTSAGGEATLLKVRLLEPDVVIADVPGRFVLIPTSDGGTRLLLREALAIPERADGKWIAWDPLHFVMEQRMLRGIKERAEGLPLVPGLWEWSAHVGWAAAGAGLLGLFAARARYRAWLVVPLLLAAPALVWGHDANAALAGFLAVGLTICGAVRFGLRWCWLYLVVASSVALVLLLAPDAYAVLGVAFLGLGAGVAMRAVGWSRRHPAVAVGGRVLNQGI